MELKRAAAAGAARSNDILIRLEPGGNGIEISLSSTVDKLYGEQICHVLRQALAELGVANAVVAADDHGALDFTIRARVKAAVLRAAGETQREESPAQTERRSSPLRRTMLYVPGNSPGMLRDAGIYGADCILLDLEDSIAVEEKDAARALVVEALRFIDYGGAEVFVRINDLDAGWGREDLRAVVSTGKAGIRLPKVESAQQVLACDREMARWEAEAGLPVGSVSLMASIESSKGVLNAQSIAEASRRLVAIALGGEDFVTDLKTTRSSEGFEMLFARSMILLAARAAGIDAIDTVYSDLDDEEGLRRETERVRRLGYDGKSVINPRQIQPVHEVFTPADEEIQAALQVIEAMEQARREKKGVISLKGKMVDKPVLLRAQRTLDLAEAAGLLREGRNEQ